MRSPAYDVLGVADFGQKLILSGDLDPVYIGARALADDPARLRRWLIAYWCFYDAGAACWISEPEDPAKFWARMARAAHNSDDEPAPDGGRWPRGRERRHYRGAAATTSMRYLVQNWGARPGELVDWIAEPAPVLARVMERAQEIPGFGPWIAFKMADMLERVLEVPVFFDHGHVFMFKDPVEGARMVWRAWGRDEDAPIGDITSAVVGTLLWPDSLGWCWAPPQRDRRVNVQEIETVLCKWKSHVRGHYPLWNDTRELLHGLARWTSVDEGAARFAAAVAEETGWDTNKTTTQAALFGAAGEEF